MNEDRNAKYENTVDIEVSENGYHVDENGNVLNDNDEIVGTAVINGDGESVIVYKD